MLVFVAPPAQMREHSLFTLLTYLLLVALFALFIVLLQRDGMEAVGGYPQVGSSDDAAVVL